MTTRYSRSGGFTLVEIMIVVAIIALLAAIAVPNFIRARKRGQATVVKNDLRVLQDAMDLYYVDNPKPESPVWGDLKVYFKDGTRLYNASVEAGEASAPKDILGNPFEADQSIPRSARALVPSATFEALSDVAPAEFWSPYK